MKCNKQYVFHMLHFYYDRQEQILTPGKLQIQYENEV